MRRVFKAVVLGKDIGDVSTIEDEGSVEDAREAWALMVKEIEGEIAWGVEPCHSAARPPRCSRPRRPGLVGSPRRRRVGRRGPCRSTRCSPSCRATCPSNQITIRQGESILFVDIDPTAGPGHSFTEDVPGGS